MCRINSSVYTREKVNLLCYSRFVHKTSLSKLIIYYKINSAAKTSTFQILSNDEFTNLLIELRSYTFALLNRYTATKKSIIAIYIYDFISNRGLKMIDIIFTMDYLQGFCF